MKFLKLVVIIEVGRLTEFLFFMDLPTRPRSSVLSHHSSHGDMNDGAECGKVLEGAFLSATMNHESVQSWSRGSIWFVSGFQLHSSSNNSSSSSSSSSSRNSVG